MNLRTWIDEQNNGPPPLADQAVAVEPVPCQPLVKRARPRRLGGNNDNKDRDRNNWSGKQKKLDSVPKVAHSKSIQK